MHADIVKKIYIYLLKRFFRFFSKNSWKVQYFSSFLSKKNITIKRHPLFRTDEISASLLLLWYNRCLQTEFWISQHGVIPWINRSVKASMLVIQFGSFLCWHASFDHQQLPNTLLYLIAVVLRLFISNFLNRHYALIR